MKDSYLFFCQWVIGKSSGVVLNVENVKKMNPGAVIINVTRGAGSVLGPSWDLLNDWRAKRITWDEYVRRYVEEMGNSKCKAEMLRIGELAKTMDVYLVCFERVGNCHRFLLVDMINKMMPKVVCKYCRENMGVVDSCKHPFIQIGDEVYPRDTTSFDDNEHCHDCGILNNKGNLHHPGCDMERCPKCAHQLLSCGCVKGKLLIEPLKAEA